MRVYEIGAQNGLDSLTAAERPDPVAGPGEAILEVRAVCLNHRDMLVLEGRYGALRPEARVPVSDGVGDVIAIGEGVTGIAVGDRATCAHFVTWLGGPFAMSAFAHDIGITHDGWLAEQVRVPAAALVKIPDSLSDEQAVAFPAAGVTAWTAVVEFGQIQPGQTVIIDAGTTTYHVARYLEEKTPHIITNSLPIANLFAGANRLEVVVTGGVIYPKLGVLVGPLTVEAMKTMHADVAIMSGGGISLEGVSNSHGLLIDIQRAMLHAAQKVIFCFDHTKFGRQSVLPLCGLDGIDIIVTDAKAPRELVNQLRKKHIEVIVAK